MLECKRRAETDLSEAPQEREERQGVSAVGEWKRREDRELSTDPYDTQSDAQGHLRSDVRRARAVLIQDAEHAEPNDDERPPKIVLGAVAVNDLDREARRDSERGNGQAEGEQVDT